MFRVCCVHGAQRWANKNTLLKTLHRCHFKSSFIPRRSMNWLIFMINLAHESTLAYRLTHFLISRTGAKIMGLQSHRLPRNCPCHQC